MKTTRSHHREPTPHTDWCAQGHLCNLAEHRSDDIVVEIPGAGRAVLNRVQVAGRDYAEIRMRVTLPAAESHARYRLVALLTHLRTLIGPARTDGRTARKAA